MKSISWAKCVASCGILVACAVWAVAAPLFAPEPGLLVLKNGQIIDGKLLREGDRYVVVLGERGEQGEIKIPASEVEFVCRTLDEAYQRKREALRGPGAQPHLELAEWCLRHDLKSRAAEELVAAMAIDPRDPRIAVLERRLKLAMAPQVEREKPVFVLPVSLEEIEATLRTIPEEAIDEFTNNIQPILLHRCAMTACHGPNARSEYHLVRPPLKHANKLRETRRNLFATLAQINPDGESPLLTRPLEPHGGAKAPVFDQHDRRQVELIAAWIEQVKASPVKDGRSSRDNMVRPAGYDEELPRRGLRRLPSTEPRAFRPDEAARPLSGGTREKDAEQPVLRPGGGIANPELIEDPFDADIFNRRYHGQQR